MKRMQKDKAPYATCWEFYASSKLVGPRTSFFRLGYVISNAGWSKVMLTRPAPQQQCSSSKRTDLLMSNNSDARHQFRFRT